MAHTANAMWAIEVILLYGIESSTALEKETTVAELNTTAWKAA